MISKKSDSSASKRLSWREIMLGDGLNDGESVALRSKQIAEVNASNISQCVVIMLAAMAVAYDNMAQQPGWLVGGYICSVALVVVVRELARETRANNWIHALPGMAIRETMLGFVTACVIASPLILFSYQGDGAGAATAWVIYTVMFAVFGVGTYPMPIMFTTTMAPVGLIAAGALLAVGQITVGVATALFTLISVTMVMRTALDFMRFFAIGRRADEHGETVSLLLREFEEADADWLWQVDANRRIVRASPRFAHAVGKEATELDGMGMLQLLAGDQWTTGKFPPVLHDLANRLNRKESFSDLIVPVIIGGRQMWWELSASPVYDSTGNFVGFRGVGSDVTEQRLSADRIAHLARFDGLTGLPNRLLINESLAAALDQAATWRRRCAFMMIDLDRFKAVNDTLGHPIGDRLLAQVSARLKAMCGDMAIAGRLGGDEFGVVLKEVDGIDAIEQMGRKLIEAISRPYEIDHHTVYVGASIGYAVGPRDGASVEALTRNADLALYRSKDRGGGAINGYEPALHDQAQQRRLIEIELRGALANNEFTVYYQPVVTAEGAVDGFEALLRWTNKTLGSVSPVKFIPVAEDTRLIGAIGEWVLQTACREAVLWPGSTKVAVNVSAEQLSNPAFVGSVINALSRSGLPPSRLELEVTESVFLREVSGAMQTLDQVRALGVRLSLDDFGTGYSSLGYLRMGQFSTIKVDRSFVQGALQGAPESIAIIRAVVALAGSLDMSTTAEGVETQDEADAIIALGCKKLQGYHFGRPMCADDARAIFDSGETPNLSKKVA